MEDCKARVAIYISMKCKAFCSRSIYLSNCTRAVGGWNGWNEKIIFPALDINVESTEKIPLHPHNNHAGPSARRLQIQG